MQNQDTNQDNTNKDRDPDRESIWSVPTGWRIAYFALFTLFANVGLVMMLATLEIPSDLAGWNRLVIGIIKDMAFIGAGSAIIAIMTTENARYTMILAEWMLREVIEPRRRRQIERWRQEGIEEGRQEGIEQGIEQGIDRGRAEGIEQGIDRGRAEGIEQGIEQGIEKGIEKGIDRGRAEGIEQGIDRGRAEANKEWETWVSRKMQAEANGETFDEPMPTHRNGAG